MRRGQAAVETVLVIVLATAMLIPASYLFYIFLSDTSTEIAQKNIGRIGRSFIEHVNLVYHYGENAKVVVSYSFPPGIDNMSIEGKQMMFEYASNGEMMTELFNLGRNTTSSFTDTDWSEGEKSFEFRTEPGGGTVSIKRI